ncbi:MAG TPA: metallophosphoesterase [Fimbriimonadaceae bacterium]|nr:metallophosphoesterase [Fimbriimonadaceae bacterium]
MELEISRRQLLVVIASFPAWYALEALGQGGKGRLREGKRQRASYALPANLSEFAALSLVLGRITDRSVTMSALAVEPMECYYEYGTASGDYSHKTQTAKLEAGQPVETILTALAADSPHYYRLRYRKPGEEEFSARPECRFHTRRAPGSTFTFGIQGDSHPERPFMSDPELYARTLQNAAATPPDFYICMGDDFSISTLQTIDEPSVTARYTLQRPFLGLIGQTAPVFLLNGNHEQASLFNCDQTDDRHEAAVLAQNARNKYFPTVAPDGFYSGNEKALDGIGELRDYYAWTWGDALFIVLDNYWHSKAQVDSGLHDKGGGKKSNGEGRGKRDLWAVTLGDDQYRWFKKTLESSGAKYKFVFAHHVLGTQRGGVEVAHLYEWGGHDKNGENRFSEMRPGWEAPIHGLMVKHGVTIFFQGHDHLYCRQEKDGVIYQEVPMPADQGYVAYNEDRYESGEKLPNSGHLRVTVSPQHVKVEYVRVFLPQDETASQRSGQIAASYVVVPRDGR